MKKWLAEDWAFEVLVTEGKHQKCRIGLETGDRFCFEYATPEGFCPRAMADVYTWCEVIRCGGDLTARGSNDPHTLDLACPCGCIRLRLTAQAINRDENGRYAGA